MIDWRRAALAALIVTSTAWAQGQSAAPQPQSPADSSCEDLLNYKPHRGTLEFYIQKTRDRFAGEQITPKFTNPKEEVRLAQEKWRGVRGPRLLQSLLPDECRFIDHKLLGSAGDGIVKDAGSGEFVMLRCGVRWNEQWVGFNISVPVSTLLANAHRSEKWLVGPEAESVLDWGHGGGTKTTGNHTSIGIMNHMSKFGVAVIAIDQPWHGEGPRHFFKDENDYFRFRLKILNSFVHPNVPVIGVGHSMGGIFADMMWRRSDNRHLNLASRYKSFISLSGVVDLMPGSSVREKTQAEKWKEAANKQEDLQHRIAPGDRDLGASLLQDDKVSALSGLFAQFMSLFHDWKEPAHSGQEFVRLLAIWGDSDYLYVGNEDLIDKNLLNLRNVQLKIFGPRVNFKGDVIQVGHLIFDHYRTIKDHQEAIRLVRTYLEENQLGTGDQEQDRRVFFEKVVRPHVTQHYWLNEDNRGFEALMMAAYYWDAKFQAFAKREMQGTEAFRKGLAKAKDPGLAQRAGERSYMLQFIHTDMPETYTLIREEVEHVLGKKLEVRKRDANEIILANLLQTYSANLAFREWLENYDVMSESTTEEFRKLNEVAELIRTFNKTKDPNQKADVRKSLKETYGIDADDELALRREVERINGLRKKTFVPSGPVGERVKKNVAERERINEEIQTLRKEKDGLRKLVEELTQKRNALEADLHDVGLIGGAVEVAAAVQESEMALEALLAADERVRLAVEEYILEKHDLQLLDANLLNNLPPEIQKIFDNYEQASKRYQESVAHVRRATATAAMRGHLGPAAQEMYENLQRLRMEVARASQNLNTVDGKIWVRNQRRDALIREYTNDLVPGFIRNDRRRAMDFMQMGPEDWAQIRGLFETIWSDWRSVWKERPPADKVELY